MRQNPDKMTGLSVLGKYVSKMKLNQFKEYDYAHSAEACERFEGKDAAKAEDIEAQRKKFDEDLKEQLDEGRISQSEYDTYISSETLGENYRNAPPTSFTDAIGENNLYNEADFLKEEEIPDPASGLTQEDKIYLAMKWGRLYKPNEWIALEQKYNDMKTDFDVQDSDSESALILISKTYLKMNAALDEGDIESYQKLSKVYNDIRKTAKFTAAQNKETKEDFVDCVGNLVAYCEKEGGKIPRHQIDVELDIVDKVINDLKSYNRSLVYEDTALARQIEDYLKKRETADKKKQDPQTAEVVTQEPEAIEETSSRISDDFFDRPPDYLFEDEKAVLDY